jgi:hypothetical protein
LIKKTFGCRKLLEDNRAALNGIFAEFLSKLKSDNAAILSFRLVSLEHSTKNREMVICSNSKDVNRLIEIGLPVFTLASTFTLLPDQHHSTRNLSS